RGPARPPTRCPRRRPAQPRGARRAPDSETRCRAQTPGRSGSRTPRRSLRARDRPPASAPGSAARADGHASRSCRPVSDTKTSSSVAWWVARSESSAPRRSKSPSSAGTARWTSATVSAVRSSAGRTARTPGSAASSAGLVEEQQLRPRDKRARHRESLLLAARELAHPRGALLLEPDQAEHLLHGVRGPVKTAEQPYGLFDRELVGELRILQLNPQALAQGAGARTPRPAHPEDLHLAPVGGGESFEDLDGGRLSRPVGPQESEALACIDGEIEPRDRYDVRVALREPGTTDRGNEHSQTGFL